MQESISVQFSFFFPLFYFFFWAFFVVLWSFMCVFPDMTFLVLQG